MRFIQNLKLQYNKIEVLIELEELITAFADLLLVTVSTFMIQDHAMNGAKPSGPKDVTRKELFNGRIYTKEDKIE